MENKKYLDEETYQKNKKKITRISIIILIIGIIIGSSLITTGLVKQNQINSKYSLKNKEDLAKQLENENQKILEQIEIEKQNIINTKTNIEIKIKPIEDEIKNIEREPFTGFDDAYYARKDKIEELEKSIINDKKMIRVIDNALDESFNYCGFNEAQNNTYTSKYCSLKKQSSDKLYKINNLDNQFSEFNKRFESNKNIPFYMFGSFIIIASCMIAGSIYMITKRREITAFTMQQVMPVAKEGIDTMAPTIGNVAKEITKGIKEGFKDNKE